MLEHCHRAHTVENVLSAVKLARKYGYKVIVDFIYGLPGETEEDMRGSLKIMEEIVRLGARIHSHIFAPLPQTPFSTEKPGGISPEIQETLDRLQLKLGVYNAKPKKK
jgi:radical SAM superfamily enzyme YgiQ (UPF0313 family)